MRFLQRSIAASLALVSLAALSHAGIVYTNDFSLNGNGFSDATLATSGGESFLGSSANGFGNGTDTLTLTGLAPHSGGSITFDLYIIQSWDGNGPAGNGADDYRVAANGTDLLLTSFANYSGGGNTQAYPSNLAPLGAGASNPARTGQFDAGHLGFGSGDFGDATYRITLPFTDASSTLAIDFNSLQNQTPGDEGWGLDNVTVSIDPVPEPASFAALGLGGIALLRRRRKA